MARSIVESKENAALCLLCLRNSLSDKARDKGWTLYFFSDWMGIGHSLAVLLAQYAGAREAFEYLLTSFKWTSFIVCICICVLVESQKEECMIGQKSRRAKNCTEIKLWPRVTWDSSNAQNRRTCTWAPKGFWAEKFFGSKCSFASSPFGS